MKVAALVFALALVGASRIFAQAAPACRVVCAPEFKVEPTVTFSNVFGSPALLTSRDDHAASCAQRRSR